jgi:ornithine cyclodeaminase
VREVQQVLVFGRSAPATEAYIRDIQPVVSREIRRANTVSELVRRSDLVVTTTPSREALIQPEDLHSGLHITAMGSDGPGKQELDSGVLEQADVVVCDSYDQCLRLGELQHTAMPRQRVLELGEITSGMRKGRSNDRQISICDLTGTGVQDSAIAEYAFSALQQMEEKIDESDAKRISVSQQPGGGCGRVGFVVFLAGDDRRGG